MDPNKVNLLREILERGIGAGVVVQPDLSGLRTGLRSYFEGLTPNEGPTFSVFPSGLRRHRVSLQFGKFATPCIAQMQRANDERFQLARALVHQIAAVNEVKFIPPQSLDAWTITGPDFQVEVIAMNVAEPASDDAIGQTAQSVMIPLMAAMAELIGYDEMETALEQHDEEGRIKESVVKRRERSPRNRLLCLSIHGHRCAVCNIEPINRYGEAGRIIEVHHLEPVSSLSVPRPYDPKTDLVPLCPNCHRAVHTRRPIPYSPKELQEIIGNEC